MLHVDNVCDRPGLLGIDDALKVALDVVEPLTGRELVPLKAAAGRVATKFVNSAIDLPPFDQSAVDGYGVHADDIATGSTGPFQLVGRLVAGSRETPVLRPGQVLRLLTGAAIPKGVAAMVMEEKATLDSHTVTIKRPIEAGENIRRAGEDVGAHTEIIEAGTLLDARHIAILAASGLTHVGVRKRVRVGVLSTGDELVRPGRARHAHQIHDSNGPMLQALLSLNAVQLRMLGCCPDDRLLMQRRITRAARAFDLLICTGGVSGSDADHVVSSVQAAGGRCTKVSLALKPGKPLAIGRVGGMGILALPGNPVAALVGALLFARPMLLKLSGQKASGPPAIMARTAAIFEHRLGRTEFVPVRVVGRDTDGTPLLEKLGRGGSARLRPLVLADGLASVPATDDNLLAGATLSYYPFRAGFTI